MHKKVLLRLLVISFLLPLTLAPTGAGQNANADMRDAALIVGSALTLGPADGFLRYDGSGKFIDNMVPAMRPGGGVMVTCCMTFGPDENLYVSSFLESKVHRFNGVTGEFIDTFVPANSGGLQIPLLLLFHGDYLYVGDTAAGAIRRYDAHTGAFVDNFIPDNSQGLGAMLADLQHFVFGPDGYLYVAAEFSKRVLRYDGLTGAFVDEFVPASQGFNASGLTFGPDGLLYVGSPEAGEVRRYNIQTGTYEEFIAPGGPLKPFGPVGIAFGPDGNFYTTAMATSEILRYDGKTGRFLGPFVTSGLGGLSAGRGIVWKVTTTVCHHPGGNPAKAKTLKIGYLSARDHLAHGDTLGACQ